ncbi:MAG: matrixin family metalloprotease [Polyangia bacterium]|jgi:hypothetical protein|nr:matrixin family metalloprotease [Polyangia bacterium]
MATGSPLHSAGRREHHLPWGTCVTVTPPPPAWAFREDGSLRPPSEIRRHKDGVEQILYLNIDGAHVTPGSDNPEQNQSHIPNSAVDIPAFDDAPFRNNALTSRDHVVYALSQWVTYFYAPISVKVTTRRPAPGTPYTMMLIGGSPQLIGESTGVLGIAPFDCYKDPSNVAFVFSEDHGSSLEMLVLTIVHEAGHTFGLAHIDQQGTIMYPMNPGHDAYWGSGQTTDSYACDDTQSQNDLEMLEFMLGGRSDLLPPWVEIQTPGQGAVVPSSLDARVHGTDNVVLYSVELFLDGASIGTQTLPSFDFRLQSLADGPHSLWAVGEDAHGNRGTSAAITVLVEANCSSLGTCAEGLGAVGDPCGRPGDCMGAVCAQTLEGASVCAKPCSGTDPCPLGTFCVAEAPTDGLTDPPAWCAVGSPPVVVRRGGADAAHDLLGCSAPGSNGGLTVLILVAAVLALGRRSRGRRK